MPLILALLLGAELSANPEWEFDEDLQPQAHQNAAILALRASEGFTADAGLIETLEGQLLDIYAMDASLADFNAVPESHNALQFVLEPGADLAELLEQFPAELQASGQLLFGGPFARIEFGVPANAVRVAEWARSHLRGVDPDSVAADEVFGLSGNVEWHADYALFVFSAGTVDCPSGCIDEERRYVLWQPSGSIEVPYAGLAQLLAAGQLPRNALTELKAATGDVLEVPEKPRRAKPGLQPVSLKLEEAAAREELLIDDPQDFGSYQIELTIPQLYGIKNAIHEFDLIERGGTQLLSGRRSLDGWLDQADLGRIWDQSYPWVWHAAHGWMYFVEIEGDVEAAWAYDEVIGWIYLQKDLYPWIHAQGEWVFYLQGSGDGRLFYFPASDQFRSF